MFIVVARHGERWDYIQRDAGNNWISTAERPWDPPLSPNGLKQAKRLGEFVVKTLKDKNLPPLAACYSSPFLRCRQTACQAVEAINNKSGGGIADTKPLKVCVENGLTESINKSWYRSWALPGADSTWGYVPKEDKGPGKQPRSLDAFTEEELHPASQNPVQALLVWQDITHPESSNLETLQDKVYESSTSITQPFALKPTVIVETAKEQAERMKQVVTNKAVPNQTILLVSHGGPVTHLFEKLTGQEWHVHGESKYCCVSIYECKQQDPNISSDDPVWEPLLLNESIYLDELWSDGTANI